MILLYLRGTIKKILCFNDKNIDMADYVDSNLTSKSTLNAAQCIERYRPIGTKWHRNDIEGTSLGASV